MYAFVHAILHIGSDTHWIIEITLPRVVHFCTFIFVYNQRFHLHQLAKAIQCILKIGNCSASTKYVLTK